MAEVKLNKESTGPGAVDAHASQVTSATHCQDPVDQVPVNCQGGEQRAEKYRPCDRLDALVISCMTGEETIKHRHVTGRQVRFTHLPHQLPLPVSDQAITPAFARTEDKP